MNTIHPTLATTYRKQRTLRKEVTFAGIGIHTGKEVHMRFCPAKEGTGIVFRRTDLGVKPVVIPAMIEYVCDTSRSTTLGIGDVRVHTVEHVLAALKAYDIDNLYIDVSNMEPPIGNGSSDVFVEMIEEAGIEEQTLTAPVVKLKAPVYLSESDVQIVALPYDGYRISYTLNYPDIKQNETSILSAQYHSVKVCSDTFKNEIAPCRTFSCYEEVEHLMDRGLIKGGSLANAVVIQGNVVFSKEGLRFPNEMVRHKILDMIGDLFLVGYQFHAHIIAIRAGHATNFAFAKKLLSYITTMENK